MLNLCLFASGAHSPSAFHPVAPLSLTISLRFWKIFVDFCLLTVIHPSQLHVTPFFFVCLFLTSHLQPRGSSPLSLLLERVLPHSPASFCLESCRVWSSEMGHGMLGNAPPSTPTSESAQATLIDAASWLSVLKAGLGHLHF